MTYTDPRSASERFSDSIVETLDDISTEVIDNKALSVGEVVDIFLKEVDEWHTYYQQRADFYCAFKDGLRKRLCKA